MNRLVTIEGPTASGKSKLALQLARELGAHIISADSRQVYRYMDIGTAKPTKAEMNEIPHHLIDLIYPDESYNAGSFSSDCTLIIDELTQKGIPVIVCGGTGLYISGLLQGLFQQISIQPEIKQGLKLRLETEGLPVLYKYLQQVDEDFARKISANDKQRVLRGLEVYEGTGIPMSEHWRRQTKDNRYLAYRILLDIPRRELYTRIDSRMKNMVEMGLLNEINDLLSKGYSATSPGLNTLGYKEILPHILDGVALDECETLAAQHTRNYAKRQVTWSRKHKFDLTLSSNEIIISDIRDSIRNFLMI
jgi:tRNA dimethylallyltransferase